MSNKKVSKILADERSEDMGGGFTVFYGVNDDGVHLPVVEINVRGFFTVEKELPKAQAAALKASRSLQRKLSAMLDKTESIAGHYIVSTDFTERGIKPGKGCKLKYQIFVTPCHKLSDDEVRSISLSIAERGNKEVAAVLAENGFVSAEGVSVV